MNIAKSLLLVAVAVSFTAAAILFVALNRDPVQLEFLILESVPLPMGAVVLIALALGIVIGLGTSAWFWFSHRIRLSAERRRNKVLQKELDDLRALPFSGKDDGPEQNRTVEDDQNAGN